MSSDSSEDFHILPLQPDLTEEEIEQLFNEQTALAAQRSLIEFDPFPHNNNDTSTDDPNIIRVRFYEDWVRVKDSLRINKRDSRESKSSYLEKLVNPLFYAGFIVCKTHSLLYIMGIVGKNVQDWNSQVEGKIKDFTNMFNNEQEQKNSHFLIFGPWINMSKFPANVEKLLRDQ
ncbi:hypothetical protein LIER_28696 [Lithospermum erythrorhizon]|uniref:Uncharacterized protein n=1 Tax=Lithospermum erythrorhizon TaxID=34254 RepID=A0AAV3RJX0_LITER